MKEGEAFGGPRYMIRVASLQMHPLDTVDRLGLLKDDLNIGLCNITKCCTEVCPEHIHITDNGIIPLKERVVDEYYDPVMWVWRKLFGGGKKQRTPLPVVQSTTK
jgi:succinate dehydrogenase / fumarate reductase iron-sulfur subunit